MPTGVDLERVMVACDRAPDRRGGTLPPSSASACGEPAVGAGRDARGKARGAGGAPLLVQPAFWRQRLQLRADGALHDAHDQMTSTAIVLMMTVPGAATTQHTRVRAGVV